jgi:hypothetical protein
VRKLTPKRKRYLFVHSKRLHRRALAWLRWRRAKNIERSGERIVDVYRDGDRFSAIAKRAVSMPANFCLDTNTEQTLTFLNMMWDDVLEAATDAAERRKKGTKRRPTNKIQKYYDLATIKHIGPSAALVLASLFQRSKFITGFKLYTVNEEKWNPKVAFVLRALGFHELLEMRPLRDWEFDHSRLKILKFQTGREAAGYHPGRLQESLLEFLSPTQQESLLAAEPYGGMLEAILNSHSWAYPDDHDFEYEIVPNWWITGAFNTETNEVTVCAFDQGVSIPVSLPRWTHWSDFEYRGRKIAEKLKLSRPIDHFSNDGLAIQLALKVARTKTGLPQHGKGLLTMLEVAQRAKVGRLRILSRNGEYLWETGQKPRSFTHTRPLRGTLVEWQLQL